MHEFVVPDDLDHVDSKGRPTTLCSQDGVIAAYQAQRSGDRIHALVRMTTLAFVRRGEKRLHGIGSTASAHRGEVVLMLPGLQIMSELIADSGAYQSTLVCFSDVFLRSIRKSHADWFRQERPTRSARDEGFQAFAPSPFLADLLTHLPRGLRHIESADIVLPKLSEICIGLRASEGRGLFSEAIRRAAHEGDERLRRVVDTHRLDAISVDELAVLAARSTSSFKRDFKRIYSDTPGRWLRMTRLNNARTLLAGGYTSVTEVGIRSGFSDTSAFIRAFRRRFGETPKQFQLSQRACVSANTMTSRTHKMT